MAILTAEETLERILKPKNKTYINMAIQQEERLFLHAEPILEKYNLPFTSFNNFTRWWQSLISSVKYNRIDELMNCPFFTVGVVKDIFDQLQKFIEAQDRYIEYKFTDIDYTNDYNDFLEKQNDETFWKSRIIKELKTGICSYVVIDLPSIQKTERPEPYKYFVSPRLILDVEISKFTGNVEYIIFKQSDFFWDAQMSTTNTPSAFNLIRDDEVVEKIISIDDESYKIFVRPKDRTDPVTGKYRTERYQLLTKVDHNLGYCPCIDFWEDSIKGSNGIDKCGPITLQLSNLDYILFFKSCIDYMNLYGPFPILTTYDMDPVEFDEKEKEYNTGGSPYARNQINPVSNSPELQNPRTSGRRNIGPGGGMSFPVPATSTDHDFMKNPMKFIGMDAITVKNANELLECMESKIKEKCTGIDESYLNEIAKNTEMLAASFRKEETILDWIKGNMERVHRFVTKTNCILRYGEEYYRGCTIDYGSDRLLKDATTLTKELKESLDNGMPQSYSTEIARTAAITRFSNNPEKLARMRILNDLEPYQNMSWEDIKLLEINERDVNNFIIKANFTNFISRFELENGNIVYFGSKISYSEKISIIKNQLLTYGKEIAWTKPEPTGAGGKK